MVRIVCWNTNYLKKPWYCLRDMDADVALLQEGCNPPADLGSHVAIGPEEHWNPETWNGSWWKDLFPKLCDRRTEVVKLSDRAQVKWFRQVGPISSVKEDMIAVSGILHDSCGMCDPPDR